MTVPYQLSEHPYHPPQYQPPDPYIALSAAIVKAAVRDVQHGNGRSASAAEWLRSDDCLQYCDVLGVDFEEIQRWLDQRSTQPAAAASGPTNYSPAEAGQGVKNMSDDNGTPTQIKDPLADLAEMDAEAVAEYTARMAQVREQVLAHQQQRKPSPGLQAKLRTEYEAALAGLGPFANRSQKIDLRDRFRRRGLAI